MSHFSTFRQVCSRLLILTVIVIVSIVPVQSWVSAQNPVEPAWVVRTIHTDEFGVAEPGGLAFSPATNTFVVLDTSGNSTLLTMDENNAGSLVLPEARGNAINAAFDPRKGSLFVLNRGRGEIAEIQPDGAGLPDPSAPLVRSAIQAFGIKDPQGITFDAGDGRLFVLDAGTTQIVSVAPHPTLGFDANEAIRSNRIQRISLKNLGPGALRGIAFNPSNGHLYIAQPAQNKLFELTQTGDLVSTADLASLGITNLAAMTFASSGDNTDDPSVSNLYIVDDRKTAPAPSDSQIVEVSLAAAEALPSGTTLLPTTLVHVIDASNAAWNPSAPDTTGIDYWPLTGNLLIADSEVEEMPAYWQGSNVFQSTLSGTLVSTCTTLPFTREPTGLAINPANNHIFFSDDGDDLIFEVSLGADGVYCTADDTVTTTSVANLYGVVDAEDVAYGNNTLFIAGGSAAEVYRIPLGPNGVLGGGDDGAMTHFDTLSLGFKILEGIGYNGENGTLLILSSAANDKYLGETTVTGTLLRAYDLAAYTGLTHREDVTLAPGSQNPAIKNIYMTDRGIDNNDDRNENDGEVYEINIGNAPTNTVTPGPSPTATNTLTPTVSPTITNTPFVTDLIFADGFESGNLSAWSSNTNDGGDLSVSAAAALADTRGMQAVLDDNNSIFVTDDTPNAEPRYRARFYFDPNSISMANGDNHYIFQGYAGTSTVVLRLQFRFSSGIYQLRAAVRDDASGWTNTSWFTISDASHWVELDWRAATSAGANNGGLTLWIDNVERANLAGIDNDTRRIDRIQLGAVSGVDSGTRGIYYLDAFEARRQSYIGPVDGGSLPTPTHTPTAGPTATPTNTPGTSDFIFSDGFESGTLSAWTSNANDGGDLSVSAAAALAGTSGLEALLDDTNAMYVTDDTPNAEPRYRARFYFDPNSVSMSNGAAHFLFRGFVGTSTQVIRVEFRYSSGAYQIRAALVNDGSTWLNTNWFIITDAPHSIEFDWQAATGAGVNNGGLSLWIDSTQLASLTGVDNDSRRIDRVRLGAVAGVDAGTSGTYFFDAFESRRQGYIGP